jgi:hypothetical protein
LLRSAGLSELLNAVQCAAAMFWSLRLVRVRGRCVDGTALVAACPTTTF